MRTWKVIFNNGVSTVIRVAGKSISFRECLEILNSSGYTHTDIHSLDELWEEA